MPRRPADERYLCEAVSAYLATPVTPGSIVWRYAGVRPLLDDGAGKAQDATRDYVLQLQTHAGGAPLLSVFGGKLTTYRRLAEAALLRLAPHFPGLQRALDRKRTTAGWRFSLEWTGGAAAAAWRLATVSFPHQRCSALSAPMARRPSTCWATPPASNDLGRCFGADLYQREIDWLTGTEWARTADDILWRRTKLGLRLHAGEVEALRAALGG